LRKSLSKSAKQKDINVGGIENRSLLKKRHFFVLEFLYKRVLKHGFKSCKINLNKTYSNRILFKILLCRFAERLEKKDVPQTYKIIC
jgi:hypothetical protein